MSPEQKAERLNTIAEEIDATRRLVTATKMALGPLGPSNEPNALDELQAALDELLSTIVRRLQKVAADLRQAAP